MPFIQEKLLVLYQVRAAVTIALSLPESMIPASCLLLFWLVGWFVHIILLPLAPSVSFPRHSLNFIGLTSTYFMSVFSFITVVYLGPCFHTIKAELMSM